MKNIEVILINTGSLVLSFTNLEAILRIAVLIATLIYTIMNIVRRRK